MARLDITPSVSLVDDMVHTIATGLRPGQLVTIAAQVVDADKVFISHAFFVADETGNVDLHRSSSMGGTYTNVEPMGLFWSMRPSAEMRRGIRMIKADVEHPFVHEIYMFDGHLAIWSKKDLADLVRAGLHLDKTTLKRFYQSPDVTAIPIESGKIRGMLFLPKGIGPFPGVIDMFGGAAGLVKIRAALLASRGFAALALAYVGYDDLPKHIELHMEYFEEAIDFLSAHPSVIPNGIGVVGVSKGGMLAMEMAVLSSKVKAVVAICPNFFHHTGIHYYKGVERILWNPQAELHTHINRRCFEKEDGLLSYNGVLKYDLDRKLVRDAAIQVEKTTDAEFLFIFGEDDDCVDYLNLSFIIQRFENVGKSNYKVLSYPGAGHLIEPPYTPLNRECYMKLFSTIFLMGGQPKGHAIAQERSWHQILDFLHQRLDSSSAHENSMNTTKMAANHLSKL